MKYILGILFLFCTGWSISSYAQEVVKNSSILEYLEAPKLGHGTIRVFQSPMIRALVKSRPANLNTSTLIGNYSVMNGYKVQIYSGNASNSKQIAQERSMMISELYPEFETELQYKAPFWRVRVGNFITKEEAQDFLNLLKKEFTKYGKGMYIVPSTIRIPR